MTARLTGDLPELAGVTCRDEVGRCGAITSSLLESATNTTEPVCIRVCDLRVNTSELTHLFLPADQLLE